MAGGDVDVFHLRGKREIGDEIRIEVFRLELVDQFLVFSHRDLLPELHPLMPTEERVEPVMEKEPEFRVAEPLEGGSARIPLIGWARPVPVNPSYFRNPIVHDSHVAVAGPISNFILAVAGTILYIIVLLVYKHVPALQDGGGNSFLFFQFFFTSLIQINCVLGIFNLLPVPPLDGHWVLFRFLPSRWAGLLVAIRPYGFFILIALMWTGVLGLIIAFPMRIIAGALFSVVEFAWSAF